MTITGQTPEKLIVVHVKNIALEYDQGVHRVSADAGGESLWFESSDLELLPAPEAFGSAFLLPALATGSPLVIDGEVSEKWLARMVPLVDTLHQWWGYPKLLPQAKVRSDRKNGITGTGLFFSAGADSFHTLLRSDHKIDLLVTVHGFDIKLQDTTRMAALRASLDRVAAELGMKPVVVRTNFREHPIVKKAPWERSHGGALAAVGHLLTDTIDRILISSSYPLSNDTPWGSHWTTDPLWSSDRLQVVHYGAEFKKVAKVRSIAAEPLVREHLRVCWENRSPEGNCSRCEKCLRTRLTLADCGELRNFPVFEGEESLARQLDALPMIKGLGRIFGDLANNGRLAPDVHKAVRRLLKRTKKAKSYPRLLVKNSLRRALLWTSNHKT